jgi:3-hydroxymyristoyl/3-hydroxydecanoyl-(acyl carrier protein) dehydratase
MDGRLNKIFSSPELSSEKIFLLIPQRPPMMMVDSFYGMEGDEAYCGLTVRDDCVFCIGGFLIEPGIIEHSAQSVAAMAGYRNFRDNLPPEIGYIGEIKSFSFSRLPRVGEQLHTVVKEDASVLGTTLASVTVFVEEEKIAEGKIKFSLQGGNGN